MRMLHARYSGDAKAQTVRDPPARLMKAFTKNGLASRMRPALFLLSACSAATPGVWSFRPSWSVRQWLCRKELRHAVRIDVEGLRGGPSQRRFQRVLHGFCHVLLKRAHRVRAKRLQRPRKRPIALKAPLPAIPPAEGFDEFEGKLPDLVFRDVHGWVWRVAPQELTPFPSQQKNQPQAV